MCSQSLYPVFKEEVDYLRTQIGEIADELMELEVWASPASSTYYVAGRPFLKVSDLRYSNENISFALIGNRRTLQKARSTSECNAAINDANARYINELIHEGQSFIDDTLNAYKKRTYFISFSGGKDSTVVSHMVMNALGKSTVLHVFSDTTIEFPDTYKYLNQFQCKHPLTPLITCRSPLDFFDVASRIGPPSRILRWCCSTHKINPLSKIVGVLNPHEGVLAFEGVRKFESVKRANYERISTNHKIGGEVLARPLLEWTDLEVWIYILYHGLDLNQAYRKGMRRVGCIYCPFNSCWSEVMIRNYFPEQYSHWTSFLRNHAVETKHINPDCYKDHGWRVRAGGRGLEHYRTIVDCYPCALSDNAFNYQLTAGDVRDVPAFLRPLGPQCIIDEDSSSVSFIIRDKIELGDIATVECSYVDNSLRIRYLATKRTELLKQRVEKQIRKLQACIQCGACTSICPTGANKLGEFKVIDDKNCNSCLRCVQLKCPAVKALHYTGLR